MNAVLVLTDQMPGDCHGHTGLTDSRRPNNGYESPQRSSINERMDFLFPADQTGQEDWKIRPDVISDRLVHGLRLFSTDDRSDEAISAAGNIFDVTGASLAVS
jgi:hypothetical protein